MFYYIALPFNSILDFFDRGGPVIVVLFILAVIMTSLLIERVIFYMTELQNLSKDAVDDLGSFKIQGLIALCPLLGLLGTVTGMIEVFDIMAITGTGNARLMASGIARATLPTMTGLFVSIVGLFLLTGLKSSIDKATLSIKYEIEQVKS